MTRTFARRAPIALAALLLTAAPASAQVVHSLHVGAGGFFPRALDNRIEEDVLLRNFVGAPFDFDPNLSDALDFRMRDFRTGYFFGEWNVSLNERVEVGAGAGFLRATAPSRYLDVVDEVTRADVRQRLRLRIVPVSGVVRFLPFGTASTVQPYIGAGVSALLFRYREEGEFVDPFTAEIFEDRFTASGSALGTLVLGGVRIPIGGDVFGVTFEYRHQFGAGKTGGEDEGFLADKIDLTGGQFTGGLLVRF